MTGPVLVRDLLGHAAPDPGCAACFDVMDEVAEAQAAGQDVARRYPGVAAHVRDCGACHEDLDGLRAFLESTA